MKQVLVILFFVGISSSISAQKTIFIKDTFINHYLEKGKLVEPFIDQGDYHKKTRRKKGKWVEFSVVSDFEYKIDPKHNEPQQYFAQYIQKSEGKYKDGKKIGVWNSYLIRYGVLTYRKYKSETYTNGIKEGEFFYYFTDGKVGIKGKNVNEKYHGVVRSYFHDGSEYGQRIYKEGKATGKHVYHYADGSLRMVLYYFNDKKNGEQITYYPNGKIKEKYSNKNNKTHGKYQFFHSNGQLWVEKEYVNDRLVNVVSCFDSTGKPLDKGTLKNGNGTVKFYRSDGKVYAIKTYTNGVKVKTERVD